MQANFITGGFDPPDDHRTMLSECLREAALMSPDVETQNRMVLGILVRRIIVMQNFEDMTVLRLVERAVRKTFPAPDTIARTIRTLRQEGVADSPKDWTYGEYLNGARWKQRRAAYIASLPQPPACQMCRRESRLEVHHNTYVNIGCELDRDLILLCWKCHGRHHKSP